MKEQLYEINIRWRDMLEQDETIIICPEFMVEATISHLPLMSIERIKIIQFIDVV